jgi:hypothetical protein
MLIQHSHVLTTRVRACESRLWRKRHKHMLPQLRVMLRNQEQVKPGVRLCDAVADSLAGVLSGGFAPRYSNT